MGVRRWRELVIDGKIEGLFSTGHSPQWDVAPTEEDEDCLFWGKDSVYIFHMTRCVYSILWSGCLRVFLLSFHKGQMTICVSSNKPCGKGRDWMSLLLLQLCQNTTVCLCADCSANWHRLWQNKLWEPVDLLHLLLSWQTLAGTAPGHWSQLCQLSNWKF